jgi:hypothetical protein
MSALHADEAHAVDLRALLARHDQLSHLRVRRRGDALILESGPEDDPVKHVRFRRVAMHLWIAEMATHTGRWQPSGLRGRLNELLETVVDAFGWVLTPIA